MHFFFFALVQNCVGLLARQVNKGYDAFNPDHLISAAAPFGAVR
jgi:hypothetical protein